MRPYEERKSSKKSVNRDVRRVLYNTEPSTCSGSGRGSSRPVKEAEPDKCAANRRRSNEEARKVEEKNKCA